MKKTAWFPATTTPVRKGVYEVDSPGWFAFWNGTRFGYRCLSPYRARKFRNRETQLRPLDRWRGILK